jgi:hypothetical protein
MHLQEQLSRKVGKTTYAKYVLVIKPELVKKLGWKAGQELGAEVKEDKLIIEKE